MAVKTYSYKKNKKLSTHFYSNEFASKSGSKLYDNKILIEEGLVKDLEKFFDYGITSIVISSGYRTPQHSIDVGGGAKDAHTYGLAADIIGYVNNKVVPQSYMACYAQLIGFNGIGIINGNEALHVDKRTAANYNGNGHWWGDERPNSRTDNIKSFFTYFKLTEDEVKYKYKKKPEPKKEVKKEPKISVTYRTWDDVQNKWLPKVVDKEYAGVYGHDVCAVEAKLSKGNITYRVHVKGGKWLPAVKNNNDYAGIYNQPIDAITIKTDTGKTIQYRVHYRRTGKWSAYVNAYGTSKNKYAGKLGQEIDAIQIYLK